MKERDFLELCKKELGLSSVDMARERRRLFWDAVMEALEEDGEVKFKDWGTFYKKEVKSRRIKIPHMENEFYSKPRSVIKFACGKGLRERINRDE